MDQDVATHYGSTGIAARILAALAEAGHSDQPLDPDILASVDEFHLGGRAATDALVADIGFEPNHRTIDIGSGIGGASRVIARHANCVVTGIDLTPEFVAAATELSAAVDLSEQTHFKQGSALALPFEDADVDVATMIHVGMNIEDKSALMSEVARVLAPGGTFALFDIMRISRDDFDYPVPWASDQTTSFVESPGAYVEALQGANFAEIEIVDRTELVGEVISGLADAPPPPVELAVLMGAEWPTMIANLLNALFSESLAPVQITAVRQPSPA